MDSCGKAESLVPEPGDASASSAQAPQAWDRYAFVYNNPVRYVDPSGHDPCLPKFCGYMVDGEEDLPEKPPFDDDLGGNKPCETENENGEPPPLPLGERARTAYFILPFFVIVDGVLVLVTLANTGAMAADPEPLTKLILLSTEILVVGADIAISFLHISYAHWVLTGEFIDSPEDILDWNPRP